MEPSSFGALTEKKNHLHIQPLGIERLKVCVARYADGIPRAQKLIGLGAVYVNQIRVIDPEKIVEKQDIIRIHLDPKRYVLNKKAIGQRVLAETSDYVVVDKPSGLPVHPTLDNLRENLMYAFDFPVFVTHRLDVPTSGLVVVAKTKEYQRAFNKVISERRLRKIYQVWSLAPPPVGLHRHFMKVSVKAPKEVTLESDAETPSDECLLEVISVTEIEFQGQRVFESTVQLQTGRTHQIRAQFLALGCPLLGDEMYGGVSSSFFGLHACEIEFTCPIKKEVLVFKKPLFLSEIS